MKFAVKDKDRFKDMIAQLKLYNDWLLQYCSGEDARRIERAFQNLAESQNDPESLRQLSKAASMEAESVASKNAERRNHDRLQNINRSKYHRLQKIAQFKLVSAGPHKVPIFKREQFIFAPRYSTKQEQHPTMAIWNALDRERVVMIEWRSSELSDERELVHLAAIMYNNKPGEICVPLCYGMIIPTPQNPWFGLVLELPEHIRRLGVADSPKGIIRFRMPMTLKQILENPHDILELGLRFRLAKMLAESVHSMHTCGWVSVVHFLRPWR